MRKPFGLDFSFRPAAHADADAVIAIPLNVARAILFMALPISLRPGSAQL
jgi:hypothetical protein